MFGIIQRLRFFLLLILCLFLGGRESLAAEPVKSLKVVTYNVLGSPEHWHQRIPALLEILKDSEADIIALQEVSLPFAMELWMQDWIKPYHLVTKDGKSFVAYEYLILSKYPIESYVLKPLIGPQGRHLFMVNTRINDRLVAVATCHLESRLEDGTVRAPQLDRYFEEMKAADDAIFLGDFNFGDGEEPDSAHLDSSYVDAWLEINKGEPGFTWNIEVSAMAKNGSFPKETSRRLDRILVRSKVWKPLRAAILGDQPVSPTSPNVFPSDHFGLEATLGH